MGRNGAGDNGANGSFIDLGGWELKRVKNGLDEAQVTWLVNELISQRDKLSRHTEHLSSLTKLAEKTVTEADQLAEAMKQEALDQAKAEAKAIVAKAEEQAQQIENESHRIQLELRDSARGLYHHLLAELGNLKQKVIELQAEFEQKLSPLGEKSGTVATEVNEVASDAAETIPAINEESTNGTEAGPPLPDNPNVTTEGANLEFELEILPPIDIMKIMEIVTYLDSSPEVNNTELIPNTDRPSIIVLLHEPVDLTTMLRTIPEVAQVREAATDHADAEGKPKKIQIRLSEKKVPQEAK